MGPLGTTDLSKIERKQDREADASLHRDKMELLDAIYKSVHHPKKNHAIGNLLLGATPRQKALVRAHLEKQYSYNSSIGAPIEAGCAERAIEAFDRNDYCHGHIARYLEPEVIERIFG